MAEQVKNQLFEKVLLGLVKLFKAVQYYPPGHPALKKILEDVRAVFSPLLADGEPLSFSVRKEGFFLHDQKIGVGNPATEKLAPFLFSRRIQQVIILHDLTAEDLWGFSRCVLIKPDEIRRLGGIAEVLQKARVSTIWVNELNISQILALKDRIENQKYESPLPFDQHAEERLMVQVNPGLTEQERNLLRLLQELRNPQQDDRYRALVRELVPLVFPNLREEGEQLALEALCLLTDNAQDPTRTAAQREASMGALDGLTRDNTLVFLLDILCDRNRDNETRKSSRDVLGMLRGNLCLWRLVDALAQDPQPQNRKTLSELIIAKGPPALPVLFEYLCDARWFVVRNMIQMLGEIRNPAAVAQLREQLSHQDVRVRRETVRALSRIADDEAVLALLLPLESGKDLELCRQCLQATAGLKNPRVLPELVKVLKTLQKSASHVELCKSIIQTLGELGSEEAVPVLAETLGRRPLWNREALDELRCSAAMALGQLDSDRAREALKKAASDRSNAVAQCALKALSSSSHWETS